MNVIVKSTNCSPVACFLRAAMLHCPVRFPPIGTGTTRGGAMAPFLSWVPLEAVSIASPEARKNIFFAHLLLTGFTKMFYGFRRKITQRVDKLLNPNCHSFIA